MKAAAQATPRKTVAAAGGRRIQVRRSGVHGKGVYALRPIAAGDTLIEYKGEVITWKEALRRHPHDPADPNHTFYFHIDDKHVIDAKVGGNAARWINHACEPNCEADEDGGRVFIKALRDLHPGEELFYDYGLVIEGRLTARLKKDFECRCGTPGCRGTMLATRRR
jgi:SET domain-containing protein